MEHKALFLSENLTLFLFLNSQEHSIIMHCISCGYAYIWQQCPTSVKSTCYKSMVQPIVEYASSVWDPHTSLNIQKLDSIQQRTAIFCLNNFSRHGSITSLLTSLSLSSHLLNYGSLSPLL